MLETISLEIIRIQSPQIMFKSLSHVSPIPFATPLATRTTTHVTMNTISETIGMEGTFDDTLRSYSYGFDTCR